MSILEAVFEKFSMRQQKKVAVFGDLIDAVIDGRDVDADRLAEALDDCGKTPEELRQAVESKIERRRLRTILDKAPVAKKRIGELKMAVDAIEAKRTAANEKFDSEQTPLIYDIEDLQTELSAAEGAKWQLFNTCDDVAILARHAEIQEQLNENANDLQQLKREADRLQANRNTKTEEAGEYGEGSIEQGKALKTLAIQNEGYNRLVAKIAELEATRAQLVAEGEELAKRRLEV